jgi:hypothetical protein
MNLKKIAVTATLAGAMGIAALGLGTGSAQASPMSQGHRFHRFRLFR